MAPTGTEQRTNLADGAVPAGAGSGDVRGDSIKHAEWAREQGGSRDDAMAIIISDRAAAAMKDPSVRLAPDGTTPIERANPLPA